MVSPGTMSGMGLFMFAAFQACCGTRSEAACLLLLRSLPSSLPVVGGYPSHMQSRDPRSLLLEMSDTTWAAASGRPLPCEPRLGTRLACAAARLLNFNSTTPVHTLPPTSPQTHISYHQDSLAKYRNGRPTSLLNSFAAHARPNAARKDVHLSTHICFPATRADDDDFYSTSQNPDDVVITLAIRTPLAKGGKGGLKDTPLDGLVFKILEQVVRKSRIDPQMVEDICLGNVGNVERSRKHHLWLTTIPRSPTPKLPTTFAPRAWLPASQAPPPRPPSIASAPPVSRLCKTSPIRS